MKVKKLKLKSLTPLERNIRLHNEMQIRELRKSYEKFGQIRPIVIDEKKVILAGNGLYEGMKQAGATDVSVLEVRGLSENEKNKLVLADNKVYELGATDNDLMIEILQELKNDNDFDIPGFDPELLEALTSSGEEIEKELSGYGKMSEEEAERIKNKQDYYNPSAKTHEEIALNSDVIKLDKKKGERPKPYVVCEKCGEKIWV